MNSALSSRAVRLLGGCATAVLASCLAIFLLNLFQPPRDLSALLPTRTPTRRPPPTITPVVYPPTPPAVFRESFEPGSEEAGFPAPSGATLPFGYVADGYRLAPPTKPGFIRVLSQGLSDDEYRNLSIDATAAPLAGSAPVEYGVLFWHLENEEGTEQYLAFTIGTDSTFRLRALEPITRTAQGDMVYQWTDIVTKTASLAIKVDGSPNTLRVDVHPRRLLAYINDTLVIDTAPKLISDWRNQSEFDGRVGIIAFLVDEPGAEVRFTRFDVYADIVSP